MPLDKNSFENGIKALEDNLYADTTRTPDEARQHYASGLATLIETFVKSATVTVPGTGMTAGGNAVTGNSTSGTLT